MYTMYTNALNNTPYYTHFVCGMKSPAPKLSTVHVSKTKRLYYRRVCLCGQYPDTHPPKPLRINYIVYGTYCGPHYI